MKEARKLVRKLCTPDWKVNMTLCVRYLDYYHLLGGRN